MTDLELNSCIPKDHIQIELYGDLDELNCILGVLVTQTSLSAHIRFSISRIQKELILFCAELYNPLTKKIRKNHIKLLEKEIVNFNKRLPAIKTFILANQNFPAALCHWARAICRRAERTLVKLSRQKKINSNLLVYLNRLSKWLFVVTRILNKK